MSSQSQSPATILDEIVANTRTQVASRKSLVPIKKLEQSVCFSSPTVSLARYLTRTDLSGIIAEFKRRSPSAGTINQFADVESVSIGYMQGGACALSILTDETFFGGSIEDLQKARFANFCPILRKDFIVDEYQIVEAKSCGADAVLLIASVLSDAEIQHLAEFANQLHLEVLLEVHDESEMKRALNTSIQLIGINNRDLKKMKTDITTTTKLLSLADTSRLIVSESGISDARTVVELKKAGVTGFLIGETFMKHPSPAHALTTFIGEVQKYGATH